VAVGCDAGFNYAKAGVILVNLQLASRRHGELGLFLGDEELALPTKERNALMDAMDVLNRRFGRDSVRVGSATLASHDADVRSWVTKQERNSPRFSTRLGRAACCERMTRCLSLWR